MSIVLCFLKCQIGFLPAVVVRYPHVKTIDAYIPHQGPSREEWLRRVKNIYEEFLKEQNIEEAVENYRCLKVPERFTAETVHTTINYLLTLEGKCSTSFPELPG